MAPFQIARSHDRVCSFLGLLCWRLLGSLCSCYGQNRWLVTRRERRAPPDFQTLTSTLLLLCLPAGLKRLGSAVSINFLAIVIPPIFATSIGSKMVDQTIRDGGADRGTPESYRFVIIWEALAFIFAGMLLFYVRWRVQSGLKQVV